MIKKMSEKLTKFYIDKNNIDKEEQETYCYCFEVLLSTIINLIVVIIIGVSTKQYFETLCFIITFMFLRGSVGGHHSKTHLGCLLTLITVFAGMILLIKLVPSELLRYTSIGFAIIGWILILLIAPVDNINKEFSIEEEKKFRKKTLVIINVFVIIYTVTMFFAPITTISLSIAYAIFVVAISAIMGSLINKIEHKETNILMQEANKNM